MNKADQNPQIQSLPVKLPSMAEIVKTRGLMGIGLMEMTRRMKLIRMTHFMGWIKEWHSLT